MNFWEISSMLKIGFGIRTSSFFTQGSKEIYFPFNFSTGFSYPENSFNYVGI